MARSKSSSRRLSSLSRERPNIVEMLILLHPDAKLKMEDRSLAILESSHLETQIEDCMAFQYFKDLSADEHAELFNESGPLGSFASKIKMGYALGLFGKYTRGDLDTIRRVRNAFAHARRPISFATPEIGQACLELRRTTIIARPPGVHYPNSEPWPPIDPRNRFLETTSAIQLALLEMRLDASPVSEFNTPKLD